MKGEYTDKYIKESMPRKHYVRKAPLPRKTKFRIWWVEILVTLFVVIMLIMVFVNYMSRQNISDEPLPQERNVIEVDIGVSEESLATPTMTEDVISYSRNFYI